MFSRDAVTDERPLAGLALVDDLGGHPLAQLVLPLQTLASGLAGAAGIRDIVGGRSAAYEKELRNAKAIALQEMSEQAEELGANAVVGVDLDYETIQVGSGGGMLMVSASGTAVVLG